MKYKRPDIEFLVLEEDIITTSETGLTDTNGDLGIDSGTLEDLLK